MRWSRRLLRIERRCFSAEERSQGGFKGGPVGEPILNGKNDEAKLGHGTALGLQVDRFGVDESLAAWNDDESAATNTRALLIPKRELPGELRTTVTVYLPELLPEAATVLFAFPGGGFGRGYYDIRALPGYSQAEHHVAAGFVFVACDHLCVGDSSRPSDPFALSKI